MTVTNFIKRKTARGYTSDYFVCDTCGEGMYLKIMGNETYCRFCSNGRMKRS